MKIDPEIEEQLFYSKEACRYYVTNMLLLVRTGAYRYHQAMNILNKNGFVILDEFEPIKSCRYYGIPI